MDIPDLENRFIIVKAKGVRRDLSAITELRLMDDELEPGVKALVDDEKDAIVAFLFTRGSFTDEQAKAWVTKANKEGVNLALSVGYPPTRMEKIARAALNLVGLLPMEQVEAAMDDLSHETVRVLLIKALEADDFYVDGHLRWPWLQEVFADYCIVEIDGELFKIPYSINELNEASLGEMTKVLRQYVPAAGMVGLSMASRQQMALHVRLRDVPAAFADSVGDDGLIWKEILRVSSTFRPYTGEAFEVDQEFVDDLQQSFDAKVLDQVPITASTHYTERDGWVPAEDTKGMVERLVTVEDHLYAGLSIADVAIKAGILEDETIRDVSIFALGDLHDRRTGKVWPWILVHLLLTNYPQVTDLEPFGEKPESLAASYGGAEFIQYMEVAGMTGKQAPKKETPSPAAGALSAEQQAALEQYKALEAQGFSVETLVEQQKALKSQARDLEVRSIVASLEGTAERDDVSVAEGYRHYPAVIVAVEKLLRGEGNDYVSASVEQSGKSPIDCLILAVVNALPSEARLKIGSAPPRPDRATPEPGAQPPVKGTVRTRPIAEDVPVTEAQIEALEKELGV